MRAHVLMTAATVTWLAAVPVHAQDATWVLQFGLGNYNSAVNWAPTTVPTGTAFFGTTHSQVTFTAPTAVGGWTFNVGASAHMFTNVGQSLQFNGAGIVVNGGSATIDNIIGVMQFNNASTAGNATINNTSGILRFNNTSTAGNATINNTSGGVLQFNNASTAGNATISNSAILDFSESSTAGSATIINAGNSTFRNNSTAANATITNNGDLFLRGNATAANADITNNSGSQLTFLNATTAGNATITNNAGAAVSFFDRSTGGNAAITNTGGASVDFSASTGPAGDNKLTVGSIAGPGLFQLGANELTVGGNDLSTEVSGLIAGIGGSLVKVGTGTLTLSGTSIYNGATTVNAGTLRAGALNTFSPTSAVMVASGGTLDLNGFNQTLASVANAGLVNMGTRAAPGTVLTTPSYTGTGGTIAMNSFLGTDNSRSDRLVINGGQASGNSLLRIANAGGPGELTTANGIQVVSAVGGGTTAPGAFALGAIVAAGAYEYQLFQGGVAPGAENDWFLRSSAPPGPTTPPTIPTTPPTTPPGATTPPQPPIPLFRPEAALYTLLPGVARQLSLETLGTFHERQGDQTLLLGSGALPGAWGRFWGGHAEERRSGRLSPEFEGELVGFQVGQDLFGRDYGGHHNRLGLFFGYGRADVDARGFALALQRALVGDLTMDSTSLGAYWTHLGPSKWYVDAVLMASWIDGDPRSTRGVGLNADGTGLTASLEAGYPIPIGAGLALELQGQLMWQRVKFGQTQDPFATVHFEPDEALTGRIGARLFSDVALSSMKLKPYLLANVWRTFSGSDTTTFNITPITTDFGNTSLELGGGVVAQLSRRVGVSAAASYITNLGGNHRQGVKGNIELRVTW